MDKAYLESIIKDIRNEEPTYKVGAIVKTADVLQKDLNNPWFMSINNMSPADIKHMVAEVDAHNGAGYSVVVGDKSSANGYRTYLNPLTTNDGPYSSSTGKVNAFTLKDNNPLFAHLILGRKETPTLFSFHNIETDVEINSNTSFTKSTILRNTPIIHSTTNGTFGDLNADGQVDYRDLKKYAEDRGFTVTSTTGGAHNKGSMHYHGMAIDVRTRDKTTEQVNNFINEAKAAGLRVLDERQRPPGQKVWCIASGAQVLTQTGLLPIERVAPGSLVWGVQGWNTVTKLISNGIQPVVEITTKSGLSLCCTKEHILLGPDGEVRVRDLTIGSDIYTINGGTINAKPIDNALAFCMGYMLNHAYAHNNRLTIIFPKSQPQVLDEFISSFECVFCYTLKEQYQRDSDFNIIVITEEHIINPIVKLLNIKSLFPKAIKRGTLENQLHFVRGIRAAGRVNKDIDASIATLLKTHPKDQILEVDTIIDITELGKTDTWDLALDKEHYFWCQGFYVHNSGPHLHIDLKGYKPTLKSTKQAPAPIDKSKVDFGGLEGGSTNTKALGVNAAGKNAQTGTYLKTNSEVYKQLK